MFFRAGARPPRRTGEEEKHVPIYPSVSVVSGDALSFFSLGVWRTHEGLFEKPAGGRTLFPAPLWVWEAGRGVSRRATASVGRADSRDSRGLWRGWQH